MPWAPWEVRRDGPGGAGHGGAGGRHPRPAALSLFPRDAEEDGEDAIIQLLKRAKVRRRPLRGHGGLGATSARGLAAELPLGFPPSLSPQLSVMKGELGEADRLLHQALRLSHQADNRKAIVYTYSMVGVRGVWAQRGTSCSVMAPVGLGHAGRRRGAAVPFAGVYSPVLGLEVAGEAVAWRLVPAAAVELQHGLSLPDGKRGLHAGTAGQRE